MGNADARLAVPGPGWRERRVPPRHAPVWVRLGGTWRRGRVTAWIRSGDRPGWECRIEADEPGPGEGLPWGGRYVYDPAAIRPRYGSAPPDSAGDGVRPRARPGRPS
jgi:hypothetical protein